MSNIKLAKFVVAQLSSKQTLTQEEHENLEYAKKEIAYHEKCLLRDQLRAKESALFKDVFDKLQDVLSRNLSDYAEIEDRWGERRTPDCFLEDGYKVLEDFCKAFAARAEAEAALEKL